MLLYLPDITESERQLVVDELFTGETLNNGTVLRTCDMTLSHYRAGETISLTFAGQFAVEAACDRCSVPVEVSVELKEQFILFPQESNPDMDYVYSGDAIELDPFVREAIVLNIPQKILCDEECKGLCPICGKDRNDVDCGCMNNGQE